MAGYTGVRSHARLAIGLAGTGIAGALISGLTLHFAGSARPKGPVGPRDVAREITISSRVADRAPASSIRVAAMPPAESLAPPADPLAVAQRLLADMADATDEDRLLYELQEKSFLRHPEAASVLKQVYSDTEHSDVPKRLKAVDLASMTKSVEAVPFLEEVAMAPQTPPDVEGDEAAGDPSEMEADDMRVKQRAGAGLAESVAARVTGSLDAVQRVLTSADPAVARATAVELFGKGLLTSELGHVLRDRGLPTEFDAPSKVERDPSG